MSPDKKPEKAPRATSPPPDRDPEKESQTRPSLDTHSMTEKGTEADLESIKPSKASTSHPSSSTYEPQIASDTPLPALDTIVSNPEIEQATSVHTRRSIASRVSRIASIGNPKNRGKSIIAAAPIPITDLDGGVVGWDGQDDPEYPLNFTSRRKWTIMSFLSLITFMTPFASSMPAPAISYFKVEFGTQDLTLASLPVTIYLIGYAVGPLFLAPLSEIYGRHRILTYSSVIFCLFQIGCALAPNLAALIIFRLIAGIGGSACITIGGGVVADLFPVEERALALSFWIIGPTIGPTIGPLIGAFVAESIGWRWDFWIVLVPGTLATIALALWSRETNHRVLVGWRVRKLRKETGRTDLRSSYDVGREPESMGVVLVNGLIRPIKMLFMAPVLTALSLYVAFAFGLLYLLFNTIPIVFVGTYSWPLRLTGLIYVALGLGYFVGLIIFASFSDKRIVRQTARNNGVYEPEMRLLECFQWACILPITFFWYGWSAYYQVHWIVPIIGLFPFAMAMMCIWQPCQAYIVDAYGGAHAASGIAAFTTVRSLVGAFLPLAGPLMYDRLGLGWGNSLLGFICVALAPVPLLIYKYGEKVRKRWPVKL